MEHPHCGEFPRPSGHRQRVPGGPAYRGRRRDLPGADLGPAWNENWPCRSTLPGPVGPCRHGRRLRTPAQPRTGLGDRSYGVPSVRHSGVLLPGRPARHARPAARPKPGPSIWNSRGAAERAGPPSRSSLPRKNAWHGTPNRCGPGWGWPDAPGPGRYNPMPRLCPKLFGTVPTIETTELPAGRRAACVCVRLEELVATARWGPPEQLHWAPSDVRKAFWQGRCGLALTWPPRRRATGSRRPGAPRRVLPNCPARKRCLTSAEPDGTPRPREGPSGADAGVAACGLVLRLARPGAFVGLSSGFRPPSPTPRECRQPGHTLFRLAHLANPLRWVEKPPRQRRPIRRHGSQNPLPQRLPFRTADPRPNRIPDALDAAVRRAVAGQSTPAEALQAQLNNGAPLPRGSVSRCSVAAYRRSLGLEP